MMMKAFAFFTSSSKKKENNKSRANDDTQRSFPSLESNPAERARVAGKRAFSCSTPHLPTPTPTIFRKSSVFRRPRFLRDRDASPAQIPLAEQAVSMRPTYSRRSLSFDLRDAHPPDFVTPNAMVIPPMLPLPREFARATVSRPPREPLPVPPAARSHAESRAVFRSATRAGTRRRSRSFTEEAAKRAVPALDDIWQDFIRDAAGDIPPMPRLHSYDVSPTTRAVKRGPPTRPLPELPKDVPGIVISCGPSTPPGIGVKEEGTSTPGAMTPRPSWDAIQHLAPSLPSGCSLAATSYFQHENVSSPQLNRQLSCSSSSEISLSLFPLPPACPPRLSPAVKTALQPRTLPQCVPPPLEYPRASFDSDPESPISPIDAKFPPLLKFYPLKAQASMDSVSTVTTEEWSEISLSYSPPIEPMELHTPWSGSHQTPENTYGYDGGIAVYDKVPRVGTRRLFVS